MKTPIASLSGVPGRLVTSSAAPGVDQAVRIGVRYYRDSPREVMPIPSPNMVSQPPICIGVAPAAAAA